MSRLKRFLALSNEEKKIKLKNHIKRTIDLKFPNKRYIPDGYKKRSEIFCKGPKVSVLLPIYNHADVAILAIESILNQTYKNIELIILDDGSKDNLLEKLEPYKNLENVKIYRQENQKLPRALTHLHGLATGEFITWTSADNVMKPVMIERLVSKLLTNPKSALVYGDVSLIDAKGKPFYGPCRDVERDIKCPKIIRLSRTQKPLSIGTDNYINASFLYRKDNSDVLMGIYGDDIIGAEDYDYWLRLGKTGSLTHIRNMEPYYYYRVHDNSMSHELETKKAKIHQSRLENLRKYEQARLDWCHKRCNAIIDSKLDKKISLDLEKNLNELPVNVIGVVDKKSKKNIVFSNGDVKEDVYVKVLNGYFELINNKIPKNIVKTFSGLDVPREAYRARNMYSHSYYQDDLTSIKKPIFGCHINSSTVDILNIREVLAHNADVEFVFMDEIENKEIHNLKASYNNFIYYPNKKFGLEYQTYSHFARFIAFKDEDITNEYKNILLAYATGRRLSYSSNSELYSNFPYTVPLVDYYTDFHSADGISDEDIDIMDDYIDFYSKKGSLKRVIDYYNGHTQEMYIERPKYEVDFIPLESSPIRWEKNDEE